MGGIQVVVAALVPVIVSRFGVTGHVLWLACSLVALALMWPMSEIVDRISPERRAFKTAWPLKARAKMEINMDAFALLTMIMSLGRTEVASGAATLSPTRGSHA